MSYLVLARKWRPARFDQVVGQEGVIQTLQNAIRLNRVAHAYLFCGPRGVGKTTVARLLAKALNCEQGPTAEPDNSCPRCREIAEGRAADVFEIDGASNTGVDDVRTLRDNVRYLPAAARFKIYIIDEVHMLSTSAFNALLKTLEEPPPHVKFIFATTEPHKIPLTVLSRCQRFDFQRLPLSLIEKHLAYVLEQEGARVEPAGLRLIAREAGGSLRDALSLADQVLAFAGEEMTAERVSAALGLSSEELFFDVVDHLQQGRARELVTVVEQLFDSGYDLKRFCEGLLWHVRHLLLYRTLEAEEAARLVDLLEEQRRRLAEQARGAPASRWFQVFDIISRALEELAHHPVPRLVVETALLRLATSEPLSDLSDLVARVERLAAGGVAAPPAAAPAGREPEPRRNNPRRAGPLSRQAAAPAAANRKEPEPEEPVEVPGGFTPDWVRLVKFVSRQRPSLGSVLNHTVPLEVKAGRIRLALDKDSFFAEQLQSNRHHLEALLAQHFGQATRLEVEQRRPEHGLTLAQAWEQQQQQNHEQLYKQSVSDPAVQEAIRILGAQVDEVKARQENKQESKP